MTEINNESFGGIDWATDEHAVCVVDTAGKLQDEFIVSHTDCGLRDPCRRLARNSVRRVAIERPDGSVVDTLMEAGFEVVVVVSRSVKAFRQRYTTSGSKSDGSDAFVLADCLRSDGHRWPSLQPDTPATVTLRAHVRARRDLVKARPVSPTSSEHISSCDRPATTTSDQPNVSSITASEHPSE